MPLVAHQLLEPNLKKRTGPAFLIIHFFTQTKNKETPTAITRSFGLDPNLGVTLSVEGTSGSSDLPTGILPIGDAISIQWSASIHKLLGLALTTFGDQPASDRVGYAHCRK